MNKFAGHHKGQIVFNIAMKENKSLPNEGSFLLHSNNIVEDATIRCYDGLDTRSTSNIEAASPGDDGAGGNANRPGLLVKAATGRCHIH